MAERTSSPVADAPGRKWRGRAVARGLALFFGAFSLANAVALARGAAHTEDLWWIDLRFLPPAAGVVGGATAAALLIAWGVAPRARTWRRAATGVACGSLAAVAVRDVVAFYAAWRSGAIAPGVPFPSSALIAIVFAWLAVVVWRAGPAPRTRRADIVTALVVAGMAVAFPLVQIAFFGTTDYRRPADVAVVLGAKVDPDGSLSTSLEDRVRTGADLYRSGLASRLVMSGGVGESGIDETAAMRDRAVALGVPSRAIDMDPAGLNTDATVRNTVVLFARDGQTRVLAVSQFYHLPRIKMAYRAAGVDVRTVPAAASLPIRETPWLVLREVPAFWQYWARSWVSDIRAD